MKVLFLGTGEAFGERANTSILVDDRILLDCGLTTLQQLMKLKFDLHGISVVYISHFHADHYFGLPSLFYACKEESRKNDLDIYTPKGGEDYIKNLLRLAYRKTLGDFGFKINIHEIEDGVTDEYEFSFSPMRHSIPCMAISIEKDGKKVTYTGDGTPTKKTVEMARNSNLLISEAYMEGFDTHSSILEAARFARESDVERLALVHISRKEDIEERVEEARKIFPSIIVPEDLSVIIF